MLDCLTDIDTIQKSHDRDGNESENSYHTGDISTYDSLLEEKNRLDANLARYNQIRRKLTEFRTPTVVKVQWL